VELFLFCLAKEGLWMVFGTASTTETPQTPPGSQWKIAEPCKVDLQRNKMPGKRTA
jgi:hypothetical protein